MTSRTLAGATRTKRGPEPPKLPCSSTRAPASFSRMDLSSFDSTDLLLKRDEPVHDGLGARGAARDVNIDRKDLVDAADDRVVGGPGEGAAAAGARAYR